MGGLAASSTLRCRAANGVSILPGGRSNCLHAYNFVGPIRSLRQLLQGQRLAENIMIFIFYFSVGYRFFDWVIVGAAEGCDAVHLTHSANQLF